MITDQTETEVTSTPSVSSSDSFAGVALLLALICDPKACQGRLRQLQGAHAQVEKARADLAAERAEHAANVEKQRVELEALKKSAYEREASAAAADRNLAADKARIAEHHRALDARKGEGFFGGLTREPDESEGRDPHYRTVKQAGFQPLVIESQDEVVPNGRGLTRTTYTPPRTAPRRGRKSMRRGVDL